MNITHASLGAGVALVIASFLTSLILPSSAVWTDDKAVAFSQARADLHHISHEIGHAHNAADRDALTKRQAEVQSRFDAHQHELDAAVHRADRPAWILRGLGCLAIATGLVGYFRQKQDTA